MGTYRKDAEVPLVHLTRGQLCRQKLCEASTIYCDRRHSHAKCCDRVIVDVRKHVHLLFGGGLGLGVPVVSYAPRPMIISLWEEVLVIIVERCEELRDGGSAYNVPRGLYGGMQVAQGLTHLEQGQRSTGVGQTDSLRGTNRLRAIARTGRLVGAFGSRQELVSLCTGWVQCWTLECGVEITGRRLVRWLIEKC